MAPRKKPRRTKKKRRRPQGAEPGGGAAEENGAEPEEPPGRPEEAGYPAPPEEEPGYPVDGEAGEAAIEEEGQEAEPKGEEGEDLRRGMKKSRSLLLRPFRRAATRKAIDPEFWEEAEEALIAADAGVDCAGELVERARDRIISTGVRNMEGLLQAFRDEIASMIESFGEIPSPPEARPRVIFVVGVNGVGKTTTAAKLGYANKELGESVIFAAADTFRAAGIEQMELWAKRVGAPCVRHQPGGDPAAVVYDAIESATARGADVVIIDTAGRLHTKRNLMEELKKMWRVARSQLEWRPEALLVVDATTGQNGISQARLFGEALEIDSIALTKMDGSAKGGVVLAIGRELAIPVSYVGVGEGMADLKPFAPEEYARALF